MLVQNLSGTTQSGAVKPATTPQTGAGSGDMPAAVNIPVYGSAQAIAATAAAGVARIAVETDRGGATGATTASKPEQRGAAGSGQTGPKPPPGTTA